MKRSIWLILMITGLVLVSACSGDMNATNVGQAASGLTLPGLTPVPVNPSTGKPAWNGSAVELMYADALTACAYDPSGINSIPYPYNSKFRYDDYSSYILKQMSTSACRYTDSNGNPVDYGTGPTEWRWLEQRNDKNCNIDPSTKANKALALSRSLPAIEVPVEAPFAGDATNITSVAAARSVKVPITNLCIAQTLRSLAPGASGGEALLLSAADQRELLLLQKERAQIAMVQLALLGQLFATPALADPGAVSNVYNDGSRASGYPLSYLPMLQQWAQGATGDRAALLRSFGDELAAAVQIHLTVSEELAQLLNRSGNGRLPRGASASSPDPTWLAAGYENPSIDIWGPGSWRERVLVSLYGGDPLSGDPSGNTPWRTGIRGKSTPREAYPWPDIVEAPFVSTEITDPRVQQLLSLAQNADALYLQKTDDWVPVQSTNDPICTEGLPSGAPNPCVYQCHQVVQQPSANRLYRAVEAHLRTSQCTVYQPSTSTCQSFSLNDIPDLELGYSNFELWTKFRIAPEHAKQLVEWLDDVTPKECQHPVIVANKDGVESFGFVDMAKRGPLDFASQIGTETVGGVSYYHAAAPLDLKPRVLRETVGLYTRYARFALPRQIHPEVLPGDQGFDGDVGFGIPTGISGIRSLGAIPALVATRDALLEASRNLSSASPAVKGFFARIEGIVALIDSAVGTSSAAATPVLQMVDRVDSTSSSVPLHQKALSRDFEADGKTLRWQLQTEPGTDPFWDPTHSSEYSLLAIPNEPNAGSLAVHAGSKIFGRGIAEAAAGPKVRVSTSTSIVNPLAGHIRPSRWQFEFALPPSSSEWALIARRRSGTTVTYQPIASAMYFAASTRTIADGQYLAFNGSLSNMAARTMALDTSQPSKPAFDGFGLPRAWVPPADPVLLGGRRGDDAVSLYLEKARKASEEATAAVKEAFEEMLKQQEDEALLAAAVSKSEKVAELERSGLCGSANCDTSVVDTTVNISSLWGTAPSRSTVIRGTNLELEEWNVPRPSFEELRYNICVPQPGETFNQLLDRLPPGNRLDCLAVRTMLEASAYRFRLLRPVALQRSAPAVPSFQEYEGGSLQLVAIQQWTALRAFENKVRDLMASTDAAIRHVDLFFRQLDRSLEQNREMAKRCENLHKELPYTDRRTGFVIDRNFDDLDWYDELSPNNGSSSGTSVGISVGYGSYGQNWGDSVGTSAMSLGAKRRLCEAYRDKVNEATWRLMEGVSQAYSNIQARVGEFTEASARIQAAAAGGASLIHQADLAVARSRLESDLLRASQKSSFGLYRQLHSYDAWRAKALLESARISGVVARKAIESRYLVNLSTLTRPEPLVASPASWADEVYEYDLDMPSAVGLTVGEATPNGIYPNRMLDYVGNLERFVDGYSIARPTATVDADTEVVSIPGPRGLVDGTPPVQTDLPDGTAYGWSYLCGEGASGVWRPMPPSQRPTDVCLPGATRPTRARVLFALDPWGRLHGDVAAPPFQKRFNARWNALAVNLVGTGVLACAKSKDPLGCQSEPFIRYRMSHRGTTWLTDDEQSWVTLPIPTGRIDGAKALAAEQWFDPIENSWNQPFVAAVARGEFISRPLGGTYEIEFDLGPEVVLEKIERVQILANTNYWVKQQ